MPMAAESRPASVGDSESEPLWREFLGGLKQPGLAGVRLVMSDARVGMTQPTWVPSTGGLGPSLVRGGLPAPATGSIRPSTCT